MNRETVCGILGARGRGVVKGGILTTCLRQMLPGSLFTGELRSRAWIWQGGKITGDLDNRGSEMGTRESKLSKEAVSADSQLFERILLQRGTEKWDSTWRGKTEGELFDGGVCVGCF